MCRCAAECGRGGHGWPLFLRLGSLGPAVQSCATCGGSDTGVGCGFKGFPTEWCVLVYRVVFRRCGGMGQFSPCIEQVRRAVVLVSVRGGSVGSVICRVGMGWWSFGARR